MRRFSRRDGVGLYRSRDGMVLGVCKGFARYFDFSVKWTRIITFVLFLIGGFWPIGVVYLLAALLMKPEPVVPFRGDDERDFYEGYVNSRRATIRGIRNRFDNLNRRIHRMEDVVTSKEYQWDRKASGRY